MLRIFCTSLIIICAFAICVKAQSDVCNLELKFFQYNLENAKNPLSNLELSVINLNDNTKEKLKVETDSFKFLNKKSGKYKVSLKKNEFRERNKEVDLDCKFADKTNTFIVQVYLAKKSDNQIKENVAIKGDTFQLSAKNSNKTGNNTNTNSSATNNETTDADIITTITVSVHIDVDGNVTYAEAIDGNPAFFYKTVKAARLLKFSPTFLEGMPVNVTGNIVYRFKK